MTEPIIKVENIGKQYRLGTVGTGTFSHDVNRWWHKVRGKEDPYLKIGEVNDRAVKGESEYVWALKDINFEVQPGEILGIIGKNGAGKSTLLKILSRVTAPTTGKITCHGRIASLLEVGTGFHPELTGKDNIYLNGAILGMTKKEITDKFDEIVDFAGCANYIDTPVKRYSSGMYVRLAFAVAAHLEPDILVVDEVLAVGDAEFQKKAIGKMKEISQGQGRTVLFVSHNMDSIRNLCTKSVLMEAGQLNYIGNTDDVINKYLNNASNLSNQKVYNDKKNGEIELLKIEVENKGITSSDVNVVIEYSLFERVKNLRVSVSLLSNEGVLIFSSSDFNEYSETRTREVGNYKSICSIPRNFLNVNNYFINISIDIPKVKAFFIDEMMAFTINEMGDNYLGVSLKGFPNGLIHPKLNWNVQKLN